MAKTYSFPPKTPPEEAIEFAPLMLGGMTPEHKRGYDILAEEIRQIEAHFNPSIPAEMLRGSEHFTATEHAMRLNSPHGR